MKKLADFWRRSTFLLSFLLFFYIFYFFYFKKVSALVYARLAECLEGQSKDFSDRSDTQKSERPTGLENFQWRKLFSWLDLLLKSLLESLLRKFLGRCRGASPKDYRKVSFVTFWEILNVKSPNVFRNVDFLIFDGILNVKSPNIFPKMRIF